MIVVDLPPDAEARLGEMARARGMEALASHLPNR